MKEIWKPVIDYEGIYEVSNLGNVRSLDRYVNYRVKGVLALKKGKILALCDSIPVKGYSYKRKNVCFQKNSNKKTFHVHRLVAQAFISNPENKLCVNHKDSNPLNNNAENLEWCTLKENSQHALKFGNKKSAVIKNYTSRQDYMKQYMVLNYHKYYQSKKSKLISN